MNIQEIIVTIGMIVLGLLATYFKYNTKLAQHVADFINEAEEIFKEWTQAGEYKFEMVVNKLYNLIPKILRPLFTKEMIGDLVQRTFDAIQDYAKKQLDKIVNGVVEDEEE